MFRTVIYPSSGACDCVIELSHPSFCSWFVVCWIFGAAGLEWFPCCRQHGHHSNFQHATHQEWNDGCDNQQHSRKLLMMDVLMSETCWAHKKWNKIASDIRLVFYSSTGTEVLFTYFGLLVFWFYASFSSRTPALELGTVHVQHVVNEVPQIQESLSVLRYFIASNFRQYSVLIFIGIFFRIMGLRILEIFENMLSPMSETTESKPAFTFLVFQWLKCRCMYVLTSCIRRYLFYVGT